MTASGKRPQGTGSTDDQAFDSPFPKHLQPTDRTFLNARHDAAISIKNSPVLPASVANDYSPLPFHDTLASANHDKQYYQEKNSVFDATLAMTVRIQNGLYHQHCLGAAKIVSFRHGHVVDRIRPQPCFCKLHPHIPPIYEMCRNGKRSNRFQNCSY